MQERRSDEVIDPAALSAPRGGGVGSLRMGGSGLGDAIVAWTQGSGANTQVAAAVVDAPPDPFFVQTPGGLAAPAEDRDPLGRSGQRDRPRHLLAQRQRRAGRQADEEALREAAQPQRIGDGRHRIQVFAIDDAGQETGSRNAVLLVDRRPPKVKLKRRGNRLAVVVSDGARRETSSLKGSSVRVSFGDGSGGQGKKGGGGATTISSAGRESLRRGHGKSKKPVVKTIRHDYPRPGSYRLAVTARDRAGNRTHFERKVRIG